MDSRLTPDGPAAPLCRVTFQPMGITCRVPAGCTIQAAAARQQIVLRSECGGRGHCGQCRVVVHPAENVSPVSEREAGQLDPVQLENGWRLACEAIITGPLTVSVDDCALEGGEAIGKTGVDGCFACDPAVRRYVLPLNETGAAGPDHTRTLKDLAAEAAGHPVAFDELAALQMLSRHVSERGELTLVTHDRRGVTAVLNGRRERSIGVALDIGTTTLAVYLCDLSRGTVLTASAAANPQRRYGEDVISRIAFANDNAGGLATLQRVVVEAVNSLISGSIARIGADISDIDEMTVVGNTTMQQVFVGLHPKNLGAAPYRPLCADPQDLRAAELGLNLNPAANVHVFPVVSGFVGGDTMGAILSERPHEDDAVALLVDIGTNGEVVLGNRNGLWCTSCATGPALEGAHIQCGMRASAGAISAAVITPGTYRVAYEVMGNGPSLPVRGLCGSGIVDIVAEMRRTGLLRAGGRIREGLPGVVADEKGIGRKFVLISAEAAAGQREIAVTLADIRQIQLAKAALSAGISLLMRTAGIQQIDRLVLTGAFGARFNWQNAVAIGMLPHVGSRTDVRTVENAAGRGAVRALLDGRLRGPAAELARRIRFLELAEHPDFAAEFAAATIFPDRP